MDKITAAEQHTFFSGAEFMKINSPAAGLIASDHKDITIVPRIVPKGESVVLAMRMENGVVSVEAGEEIGLVVVPVEEEAKPAEGEL